jgi:two-component system NtrC family sensor kinase
VSNDVSWADIAAVVDLHSCSWPLAAIDEQLIVLRANPAFAALCGAEQLRETQSVVGASLASLWGQSAALVALQQEIARGRARRFKATVEQRLPDEASRELELSLSPLEGGNKQCWAVAVEQPNLTQLTHTNRLATIGTLTAALAHELGTPLNVITARGQMIVRGVTRGDRTILEDIEVMVQQAERMAQTVRDVLGYARQRQTPVPASDLRALVEAVFRVLRTTARQKHVNLELSASAARIGSSVASGALSQVLTNLIINAIDAQPTGGSVEVDIQLCDDPASHPGNPVEIRVHDRGHGVPPRLRERIFEPFFTTKDDRGTGLGLAVCCELMREQGGALELSESGPAGTTFLVRVPKA